MRKLISVFTSNNASIPSLFNAEIDIISLPFNMIKAGVYGEDEIKNGGDFSDTGVKYHLSFDSDYKLKMTVEDIVRNNRVFYKKVIVNVNYPITKGSDQKRDFSVKVIINNDTI